MRQITRHLYAQVAQALRSKIGSADYFNDHVDVRDGDRTAVLILTAIIYRREDGAPDGTRRPIADIVPIWWEFHTWGLAGPELNDFDFGELKRFLVENE